MAGGGLERQETGVHEETRNNKSVKYMKTFKISVHPYGYSIRCEERIKQEAEGYFCHSPRCTKCRIEYKGAELWGENGYMQGRLPAMPEPSELPELEQRFHKASGCRTAFKFEISPREWIYQGK